MALATSLGPFPSPFSSSVSLESRDDKILLLFFFLQPHLCIQYEVLEAAQLAIESLDGILVEGACIKVEWPEKAKSSTLHSALT